MQTARIITALQERYPQVVIREAIKPYPFATFPAISSDFGDIELIDEGDTITAVYGNFTHCHYDSPDDWTEPKYTDFLLQNLCDDLDKIFDDQIEFWGSHQFSGGFRPITPSTRKATLFSRAKDITLWSGAKYKRKS